jgi:hypothetical protein
MIDGLEIEARDDEVLVFSAAGPEKLREGIRWELLGGVAPPVEEDAMRAADVVGEVGWGHRRRLL